MNANEISAKADLRLRRIQKTGVIFKIVFFIITISCIAAGVGLCMAFLGSHGTQRVSFLLNAGFDFSWALLSSFCCKLFDLCSRGELFTANVVHSIQRVAYAYFLVAFVGFISSTVSLHLVGSTTDFQLAKILSSVWHSADLLTSLFPGLLILFIAWVMDEGRKIQEEQELTV